MGSIHQKSNLPVKVCTRCGRPFNWRKKWNRCWEDVKYCSGACRTKKIRGKQINHQE